MRTVRTTGEFMDAVRSGVLHITVDGHIEVPEPLNMADHVGNSSHFALVGGGGWTTGALYRGFDGPEPVLSFPRYHYDRERHWELRMRGVNFDPQVAKYPNGGPSLDVELMQLSVLEDLRFQGHPGVPFRFGNSRSGNVNACRFQDFWLLDNGESGQLLEASDFIWRGGTMEMHAGEPDARRPPTGLTIRGPSREKYGTYPGPGRISDAHMEFARLDVHGVDRLIYRDKYRYWSDVRLTDCRDAQLMVHEGFAPFSDFYVDDRIVDHGPRVAPGGMTA